MPLPNPRKEWPFKVPQQPDELLTSFLVRTAHNHGSKPFRFFRLYWPLHAIWNVDWDRCVTDGWLKDFSHRSGISLAALDQASLRPWIRYCGQPIGQGGHIPFLLSWGIFAFRRSRHGLVYCPLCLMDQPAFFRVQWRFATTLWCDKHHVDLQDGCGHCDAPIVLHRHTVQQLTQCYRCKAPLHLGVRDTVDRHPALVTLHQQMRQQIAHAYAVTPQHAPHIDIGLLRSVVSYLSTHRYLAQARALFGLTAVSWQRPRSSNMERMRLSVRYTLLETAAQFPLQCPTSFIDLCLQLGITQATLSRWSIPETMKAHVKMLPVGQRRVTNGRYLINTPALRHTKRRCRSTYRQQRATRLSAMLRRSIHGR